MKKFRYAVTHPGHAHRDDTLTAALLLGSGMVDTIYRRDPVGKELLDSSVIVFDHGGKFSIVLENYDHHHNHESPCALHLIAKYVLGWENPEKVFPWWDAVDIQDRLGPRAMLQHFGVNPNLSGTFKDPLGAGLVRMFGQMRKLKVMLTAGSTDPFVEVLQEIGAGIISVYKKFWQDYGEISLREIAGVSILVTSKPHNVALFARAEEENIRIVQQPNQRGEGVTLTRVNDAPGVDFNRVEEGLTPFVHSTGFMCVVKSKKYVPEVIRQALVK